MAISFPLNPSIGDGYTASGKTWTWNGAQWEGVPATSGIPYGTTANRPSSPELGQPFFNADEARLEIYTSATGWQNIVQETPSVVSISGVYAEGNASNTITINGTNFAAGAIAYAVGTDGVEIQADVTTLVSVVEISATFSGLVPANEPYDIKVVNPSNLYGVLYETLQIDNIPVFITQSGTLGTYIEESPMSVQISVTDSENSPLIFSITSGSLPTGLSMNTSTGEISGTPEDIIPNSVYSFDISATDGNNTAARSFSITINDRGPTWSTPETLSAFSKGIAYSETLIAVDDNLQTVSYSLVSGSLPTGLALNAATGEISGVPTSSSTAIFTIRATDTGSGAFADKQFTMPNPGPVWQTAANLGIIYTDSNSIQLSAIDDSGIDPTYSLVSGVLPAGMSLSATGLLSGAATGADGDPVSFTVRATDNNGTTSDRSFSASIGVRLYAFTSHTFTNAGAVGMSGPTLSSVRSAYSSASWANTFLNMSTQGIQLWTIPLSGTYKIEAAGARGGESRFGDAGGSGAKISGEFSLIGGQVLQIAVGQSGLDKVNNQEGSGGGGGGTFVVTSNDTPLIIAGGGGGTTDNSNSSLRIGLNGSYTTSGTSSRGGTASFGTAGNGGAVPSQSWSGGSGAGFYTEGSQGRQGGSLVGSPPLAFVSNSGPIGGEYVSSYGYGANGGFGGGGPGSWAGAGGGGYSGGSCDESDGSGSDKDGGGGGGSYNSGSNAVNIGYNYGHGYVTITKL